MSGVPGVPPIKGRCRETCGAGDSVSKPMVKWRAEGHKATKDHRCLLPAGHEGEPEFIPRCVRNLAPLGGSQ